tara:strand:- start:190 stop:366 length:177 start_codon:yes stop_codon:yes gene_type:complete
MEEKKSNSRFWQIFSTLLILFGIISFTSQKFSFEWYYTWGAAAVTTVIVLLVFRRLSR